MREIYELKVGESHWSGTEKTPVEWLRVPGGWIVSQLISTMGDLFARTAVFVPEPARQVMYGVPPEFEG